MSQPFRAGLTFNGPALPAQRFTASGAYRISFFTAVFEGALTSDVGVELQVSPRAAAQTPLKPTQGLHGPANIFS
jgi:hypothetical protein